MKIFSPILLACAVVFGACKSTKHPTEEPPAEVAATDDVPVCTVQFSGDSAYVHVVKQCDFGPRVPNSSAIERCGNYIESSFKQYGLTVDNQRTTLKGWDGVSLRCRNIIAHYRPEAERRIVICSHYDSRPWADNDPDEANHRKPVLAANDGASGVAVMLEVARLIADVNPAVGVDFVCFDTEDYGAPYWAPADAEQSDSWCLGSQYWSQSIPQGSYAYGILLDMVGGKDAKFCYEGFSLQYAKDLVTRTWSAAQRAGAGHLFPMQNGSYITDDHVPMNQHALIPTIDIIPHYDGDNAFGPTWHTVSDTPENIDPAVLRGVGQTLIQLLSEEK